MATPETLGIIAGNRDLPVLLAREARAAGVRRLVAVAMKGETDETLAEHVDEITWVKVGQLNKLIKAFRGADVTQCVMVGQIAPDNLFNLRPDLRAMKLLVGLKKRMPTPSSAGLQLNWPRTASNSLRPLPGCSPPCPPRDSPLGLS